MRRLSSIRLSRPIKDMHSIPKTLSFHTLFQIIFLGSFFLSIDSISAQTSDIALEVSPPITHVIIEPGKSASQEITIENTGNFGVNITPRLKDFRSDNKTGNPLILDSYSFEYGKIIDQEIGVDESFYLDKDQKRTLLIAFDIPETARLKEHHFVLLFEATPEFSIAQETSTSALSGQIASNFIVTITDSEKDLGILEMDVFRLPRLIDSFQSITPTVFLKNTGKNMTVPVGEITISDILDRKIHTFTILPQNILPNSSRQIFSAKPLVNDPQQFEAVPFTYDPPFLIGRYSVEMIYHGPNQEPQRYEHIVYAVPFSLLFFFTFAITIFYLLGKLQLFNLDKPTKRGES